MRLATCALIVAALLVLQGCCIFGTTRTVHTPWPQIPLGEAPPLTGDPVDDFRVLGADALRSRNLINRYNEMARRVNDAHGVETPSLGSIDFTTDKEGTTNE